MQTCNVSVRSILSVALCGAMSFQPFAYGQQQPAPPPAESKPAGPPPAYPGRAPGDPAKIAKGKQVFSANCSFCHGTDARGGEVGPNLVRSQIVLNKPEGALDPDQRVLTLGKANYARPGEELHFRWHDFALVREGDLPADVRAEYAAVAQTTGDNAIFLNCLRERGR